MAERMPAGEIAACQQSRSGGVGGAEARGERVAGTPAEQHPGVCARLLSQEPDRYLAS